MEENKNSAHPCGCSLRLKHFLGPDTSLEKTGQGDDGYYDFDVYECTACHFKWVCITIDNPTMSEYSWAQWNEEKYPMYKNK